MLHNVQVKTTKRSSNAVFSFVLRSCNSSLISQEFLESCISTVKRSSFVNLQERTVNISNKQVGENTSYKKDLPLTVHILNKEDFISDK